MQGLFYFIQESWKKPSNAESDKLSFSISVCVLKPLSEYFLVSSKTYDYIFGMKSIHLHFFNQSFKIYNMSRGKMIHLSSLSYTECVIFKTIDDVDELFLVYGWLTKGV